MSARRREVVVGAITRGGRLLLTQRATGSDFPLLWECPGGKVEPSDLHREAALERELREELGVEAIVGEPFAEFDFDPPEVAVPTRVVMYEATIGSQLPTVFGAIGIGWFAREEIKSLRMAPANVRALPDLLRLLQPVRAAS